MADHRPDPDEQLALPGTPRIPRVAPVVVAIRPRAARRSRRRPPDPSDQQLVFPGFGFEVAA